MRPARAPLAPPALAVPRTSSMLLVMALLPKLALTLVWKLRPMTAGGGKDGGGWVWVWVCV